jgi:hypothetical protein
MAEERILMNITGFVKHATRAGHRRCWIQGIEFRGHRWSRDDENITIIIEKGDGKEMGLTMTPGMAKKLARALEHTANKVTMIDVDDIHTFTERV